MGVIENLSARVDSLERRLLAATNHPEMEPWALTKSGLARYFNVDRKHLDQPLERAVARREVRVKVFEGGNRRRFVVADVKAALFSDSF